MDFKAIFISGSLITVLILFREELQSLFMNFFNSIGKENDLEEDMTEGELKIVPVKKQAKKAVIKKAVTKKSKMVSIGNM